MTAHNTTWILVANRAHAKIFDGAKPFALIRSIEHPEGRLKSGEMSSDKSGRAFPSYGTGSASALEKAHDPTEHEADRFAKELGALLHDEGSRNAFKRLVLIAEPRFLGKLRGRLPRATAALVDRSFSQDIAGLEGHALIEAVEELLTIPAA